MYQDDHDMLQQDVNIDSTERILDRYSSLDYMTSWIVDSSSTYTNPNVENPWPNEHGNVSIGYNTDDQYIQQNLPTSYQTTAQSPFRDFEIYNKDGQVEPMEFDEVEPQTPYVILLDSRDFESKDGSTNTTPWIYLWKAEKTAIDQLDPLISSEEVRLERARYVKNPEMQAAKAFYNALQILRRILQANEAELSPHLRTHHERTNCEAEMIQSFREYELHSKGCSNCCSPLMSLKRQIPLCELGMSLAEKVFLAIDWYATATFGDYETVTLEVSDHSVRSLLLAFTDETLPSFQPEEGSVESLAANAPVQTLAAQSLGIISSIMGVEDKTSTACRSITPKRKRFSPGLTARVSSATTTSTGRIFLDKSQDQDHLTANPESIVSCLDDYLNVPARRRFLRSQISQEGMRSIRRLFNVSLHGYNLLERAFNESVEEDYDFYQDFPNHTDLLSLGVQTFIELSNEKPSYPTALREVYSVLHLCDSINQILPQEKHERQKRVERFIQELKDWRNIIEAHDERSAFELIVQVRWPSPYLRFSRRPSENPIARRIKAQPENISKRKSEALSVPQATPKVNTPTNSGNARPHAHTEEFNPMSIALLWMQLIAGIVFTTIAAYFSFNHRMVNIFVQYLSGGDPEVLNSSQTIHNASTRLPNNSAWISSTSIKFIEKTKRFVISKLKVSEFDKFSQAVEVAMDSLSCGWISTIKDLETVLLRVAKLIECTKLEFQTFVQRVLDLCTACAANMTSCETHRMSRKRSSTGYNYSYEPSNPERATTPWIADEDEIPLRLPKSVSRTNSNLKSGVVNNFRPDSFDGPLSPALASLASSRNLHQRIKSDFLDDALMSTEDRLISDTDAYFPIENSDRDLSGGPIAAYTSIINGPTLDPVLTLENQDNLLSLSQATYSNPISKSYSQGPSSAYNASSNFDSFWSLNRHGHPLVVSSLPEHAGYYLTPSSNWNLGEDLLGSTSAASSSSTYYPPPTSIPTSLSAVYNESLKATVATSLPPTSQPMHRLSNPFLNSIAASPISPYPHPDETPRFLPTAPTPPPPVPPPKPRKRRRSSPLKEEDNNGTGTAPPPKRQKKTMLFKCPICKHDIAAPRMNLTRHIKSVHADSRQRRIECEWPGCATTFQAARKDNYRAHLRKHQEKLGDPGN
ncbi:hypothetical protein TWF694_005684 [Orbilia ellipsospora]|uniref:C2H2-type domain-containing protein n=1 Tax=Orbilia ellipsospora TaxID=2528407 RepID=A0AAV9WSL9_9PEZI